MKRLRRGVVCAVLAAGLLAGCGTGSGKPAGKLQDGALVFSAGERQKMPELAGPNPLGGRASLAEARGKVVVLNAWASWCGPCRAEAPSLERVQKDWGDRGVQVVGLGADSSSRAARAFIEQYKLSYPTLLDEGGRQALRIPRGTVSQTGYPYTVFLDRRGRVAASVSGEVSEDQVRHLVKRLLAEKPGGSDSAAG
ncbi:TlpA disulfide reductase family protein [Streptomyces sp. NPDC096012]|uniref:TlpA family protein disulfide reductase n=1 Tax=Streptomyces sp. NPDC096012 TaxID=3155684 RepID=UPI00336A860F